MKIPLIAVLLHTGFSVEFCSFLTGSCLSGPAWCYQSDIPSCIPNSIDVSKSISISKNDLDQYCYIDHTDSSCKSENNDMVCFESDSDCKNTYNFSGPQISRITTKLCYYSESDCSNNSSVCLYSQLGECSRYDASHSISSFLSSNNQICYRIFSSSTSCDPSLELDTFCFNNNTNANNLNTCTVPPSNFLQKDSQKYQAVSSESASDISLAQNMTIDPAISICSWNGSSCAASSQSNALCSPVSTFLTDNQSSEYSDRRCYPLSVSNRSEKAFQLIQNGNETCVVGYLTVDCLPGSKSGASPACVSANSQLEVCSAFGVSLHGQAATIFRSPSFVKVDDDRILVKYFPIPEPTLDEVSGTATINMRCGVQWSKLLAINLSQCFQRTKSDLQLATLPSKNSSESFAVQQLCVMQYEDDNCTIPIPENRLCILSNSGFQDGDCMLNIPSLTPLGRVIASPSRETFDVSISTRMSVPTVITCLSPDVATCSSSMSFSTNSSLPARGGSSCHVESFTCSPLRVSGSSFDESSVAQTVTAALRSVGSQNQEGQLFPVAYSAVLDWSQNRICYNTYSSLNCNSTAMLATACLPLAPAASSPSTLNVCTPSPSSSSSSLDSQSRAGLSFYTGSWSAVFSDSTRIMPRNSGVISVCEYETTCENGYITKCFFAEPNVCVDKRIFSIAALPSSAANDTVNRLEYICVRTYTDANCTEVDSNQPSSCVALSNDEWASHEAGICLKSPSLSQGSDLRVSATARTSQIECSWDVDAIDGANDFSIRSLCDNADKELKMDNEMYFPGVSCELRTALCEQQLYNPIPSLTSSSSSLSGTESSSLTLSEPYIFSEYSFVQYPGAFSCKSQFASTDCSAPKFSELTGDALQFSRAVLGLEDEEDNTSDTATSLSCLPRPSCAASVSFFSNSKVKMTKFFDSWDEARYILGVTISAGLTLQERFIPSLISSLFSSPPIVEICEFAMNDTSSDETVITAATGDSLNVKRNTCPLVSSPSSLSELGPSNNLETLKCQLMAFNGTSAVQEADGLKTNITALQDMKFSIRTTCINNRQVIYDSADNQVCVLSCSVEDGLNTEQQQQPQQQQPTNLRSSSSNSRLISPISEKYSNALYCVGNVEEVTSLTACGSASLSSTTEDILLGRTNKSVRTEKFRISLSGLNPRYTAKNETEVSTTDDILTGFSSSPTTTTASLTTTISTNAAVQNTVSTTTRSWQGGISTQESLVNPSKQTGAASAFGSDLLTNGNIQLSSPDMEESSEDYRNLVVGSSRSSGEVYSIKGAAGFSLIVTYAVILIHGGI